jgi:hypothetical protein
MKHGGGVSVMFGGGVYAVDGPAPAGGGVSEQVVPSVFPWVTS